VVARELARQGFGVFGTVRRAEDAAAVTAYGATPVLMDVTDAASIAAARSQVERALSPGSLAGLVNNAGIAGAGPLELIPLEEFRRVLEVNLIGVLAVTQAFLPLLKAARGRIVNVSSVSGRGALPFMGPYAASKFALEGMSDSLRRELLPFGVDVIVVEPGSIRSRIWDKVEALDLTRYRGTPYEPVLDRFRDFALRSGERGLPPERVATVVARVLTARRPPARVLVVESRLGQKLTEWLPDRWLDWLVKRRVWRPAGDSGRGSPPRSAPRSPGS